MGRGRRRQLAAGFRRGRRWRRWATRPGTGPTCRRARSTPTSRSPARTSAAPLLPALEGDGGDPGAVRRGQGRLRAARARTRRRPAARGAVRPDRRAGRPQRPGRRLGGPLRPGGRGRPAGARAGRAGPAGAGHRRARPGRLAGRVRGVRRGRHLQRERAGAALRRLHRAVSRGRRPRRPGGAGRPGLACSTRGRGVHGSGVAGPVDARPGVGRLQLPRHRGHPAYRAVDPARWPRPWPTPCRGSGSSGWTGRARPASAPAREAELLAAWSDPLADLLRSRSSTSRSARQAARLARAQAGGRGLGAVARGRRGSGRRG